jgi:hypothetical protein
MISSIRVDSESQLGSVIDLIRHFTQAASSQASTLLTRFLDENPTYRSKVTSVAVNGRGRTTPVAPAEILAEIAIWLNSDMAKEIRRMAAITFTSALAGSDNLAQLIEYRKNNTTAAERSFYMGSAASNNLLMAPKASINRKNVNDHDHDPSEPIRIPQIEEILGASVGAKATSSKAMGNAKGAGVAAKAKAEAKAKAQGKGKVQVVPDEDYSEQDDYSDQDGEEYSDSRSEEEYSGSDEEYSGSEEDGGRIDPSDPSDNSDDSAKATKGKAKRGRQEIEDSSSSIEDSIGKPAPKKKPAKTAPLFRLSGGRWAKAQKAPKVPPAHKAQKVTTVSKSQAAHSVCQVDEKAKANPKWVTAAALTPTNNSQIEGAIVARTSTLPNKNGLFEF